MRKFITSTAVVVAAMWLLIMVSELGFLFFLYLTGLFWGNPTSVRTDVVVLPLGKSGGEEHLYVTPLVARLYHINDDAMLVTMGVPVIAALIFKVVSDHRKRTA